MATQGLRPPRRDRACSSRERPALDDKHVLMIRTSPPPGSSRCGCPGRSRPGGGSRMARSDCCRTGPRPSQRTRIPSGRERRAPRPTAPGRSSIAASAGYVRGCGPWVVRTRRPPSARAARNQHSDRTNHSSLKWVSSDPTKINSEGAMGAASGSRPPARPPRRRSRRGHDRLPLVDIADIERGLGQECLQVPGHSAPPARQVQAELEAGLSRRHHGPYGRRSIAERPTCT